jgi:hypothetical protein
MSGVENPILLLRQKSSLYRSSGFTQDVIATDQNKMWYQQVEN